jgi:hypothetical protein
LYEYNQATPIHVDPTSPSEARSEHNLSGFWELVKQRDDLKATLEKMRAMTKRMVKSSVEASKILEAVVPMDSFNMTREEIASHVANTIVKLRAELETLKAKVARNCEYCGEEIFQQEPTGEWRHRKSLVIACDGSATCIGADPGTANDSTVVINRKGNTFWSMDPWHKNESPKPEGFSYETLFRKAIFERNEEKNYRRLAEQRCEQLSKDLENAEQSSTQLEVTNAQMKSIIEERNALSKKLETVGQHVLSAYKNLFEE